jgi:hypothetical protein
MPYWVLANLLANASIMCVEYLNRTQPDLPAALLRTWPLIVVGQVCLWYSWKHAPSLLLCWAVFSVGNSLMRLALVTSILGEPTRMPWVLGGIGLMFGGSYLVKVGTQ